jgi:hypothetical protein
MNKISPNPAQDFVQLTWKVPLSGNLKIYDTLGRLVNSDAINLDEQQKTINIAFLPKGTYFFLIADEKGKFVFHHKVAIEK